MKLTRPFLLAVTLIALAAWVSAPPAQAQTYRFNVPNLEMQVFVQADGTARIVYDITFANSSSGSPIDVVDIGLPNDATNTNYSSMQASVDGVALKDIRRSEYLPPPAIEVHLGNKVIPSGQTGILHVEFTGRSLLYQDVTRAEYVSLRITPTWFDENSVSGVGNIKVAVHMLPGVKPEELFYQSTPFTTLALFQDHSVAVWEFDGVPATGPHLVGMSFPTSGITTGIIRQSVFDLVDEWLKDNPGVRIGLGGIALVLFGILFFRFSGGTGISVFVLLSAGLGWLFYVSPVAHLFSFIPLVGLLIYQTFSKRSQKKDYLPAIAQVEGGGIKRGLTAPEAAVLLEMPLSRVLGLVIFGLLKKRVLEQVKDTPLTVKVTDEYAAAGKSMSADQRAKARLAAAQKNGIVLQAYEHAFLDQLEARPNVAVSQIDFSEAMKKLITGVADRMKGFDLSDTQDYYNAIVKRAITEANSIGDVPLREQAIDRNLEWIMMGPHQPSVFQTGGWNYRPLWVRPLIFPGGLPGSFASAPKVSLPGSGGGAGGKTSFGDVAGGFAGWAENTMGGLASAILPGSLQMSHPRGGVVNLSGADKLTGEFFKALAESSKSSGRGGGGRSGGGGGCACACAGCACACACAGGGR